MTKRHLLLFTGGIGLCIAVVLGPSSQAGATAREVIAVQQAVKISQQSQPYSRAQSTVITPRIQHISTLSTRMLLTSGRSETFVSCGVVTCTVYFSWDRTIWLNDLFNGPMKPSKQIAASLAGGVLCAFISGPIGALCAGAVLLRYSMISDHLEHTVSSGKCSAWQYNRPVFLPLGPPAPVVTITGFKSWSKYGGRVCK